MTNVGQERGSWTCSARWSRRAISAPVPLAKMPTVNTELFSLALGEFAKEVGAAEDKLVLLVVDKAGWHTGGEVRLPEGIHLEFLPSCSIRS